MSTTEAAIQINFKTKRDGMLINLRANDGFHLDELLDAVTQRLAALIDIENTVEGMATPPAPAQSASAVIANAFPGAQVVAPAVQGYKPAGGPAPMCTCGAGAMRLVPAGIAKATGRPYKGFYACPQPQGQACQNKVPA
jgi:hypothetical protein